MTENQAKQTGKTAVLLVNMGAPVSEQGMRLFLRRMFRDRAIIQSPAPVRYLFSELVSRIRYKSSWRKYLSIGGSPLLVSMNKTASGLRKMLGSRYVVVCAYSYSEPFIGNEIADLAMDGIDDFIVISMYPQGSFSTTGSISAVIDKARASFPEIQIRFVEDYSDHPLFVRFWTKQIKAKMEEAGYKNPFLLFSAHAIPRKLVEQGDSYTQKTGKSAELIAGALDLPYGVGYQSKVGPVSWTRPSVAEQLKKLSVRNVDEIILVPLSFVNENLETSYDLDTELIPYAINKLKIRNISRVRIPESDENLLEMYLGFIRQPEY